MSPVAQLELVLCLLLAVVGLELAARRLYLPPAAAFIAGGIVLALTACAPDIVLDPDLVIVLFLPPLLMSGAYFTVWREFRRNLPGILLLAVGAVAFTTLAVGLIAHRMIPSLPWASYIGGERLHTFGVLVTVTTGLILGWQQHTTFSAGTRLRANAVWEILVFLLESLVLILIGLSLRGVLGRLREAPNGLHTLLLPIAAVTGVAILSRFI